MILTINLFFYIFDDSLPLTQYIDWYANPKYYYKINEDKDVTKTYIVDYMDKIDDKHKHKHNDKWYYHQHPQYYNRHYLYNKYFSNFNGTCITKPFNCYYNVESIYIQDLSLFYLFLFSMLMCLLCKTTKNKKNRKNIQEIPVVIASEINTDKV